MSSYKTLFLLLGCIGLAACGFRPLYGKHSTDASGSSVEQRLAAIRIDAISDRTGQEFHNSLRDAINPYGQPSEPLYHLNVRLSEKRHSLAALRNLSTTREDLELIATYVLTNAKGEKLFSETSKSLVSYDLFRDPYNDLSTRRDAHQRAVTQLTEDIRNRLAVYLNRGN